MHLFIYLFIYLFFFHLLFIHSLFIHLSIYYRPCVRRGNVFVVSVSVCVPVRGVTFEADGTETFFRAVVDEYHI